VELFWANDEWGRHPLAPNLRWYELADPVRAWGRVANAFATLLRIPLADATLGWGRVAQRLRVHILPGVTNTSITTDVTALAEQIKACLDQLHASKPVAQNCSPRTKA